MIDRLWVTGLGLVTPLGTGVEATWTRLVRGDRAIRPVTLFDVSGQRVGLAAEVAGVALPPGPPGSAASWSRTSAMALTAATEAMAWARLDPRTCRVGLVVGGTTGGMFETEELLARLHADRAAREALVQMLSHPLTATGDRLAERLGPFARVRAVASACSSGSNALVVAASWLMDGDLDAVVAGGSDGLCRLTLSGFNALGAIDREPCRPFDKRRRGTSLGEGAGFLVLERSERALSRGAHPIAELAGWATGSEAHHITNPAPDGAVVAHLIQRAIARAGLQAADIDYVNAHGTGTPLNDPMEAAALGWALGAEVKRVPVSSSKGQLGHTLGAAGAIEAAIVSLVVARRTLVPTAGLDEPDPALDLVHVPHVGRSVTRVRAAMSHAFGFGGMDTVLVITEPNLLRASAHPPRLRVPSVDAPWPGGPRQGVVVTGAAVYGPRGLLGPDECGRGDLAPFTGESRVDPDARLDPTRARRLDRVARLGAVAVEHVLAQAAVPSVDTGLILGSAFGNVDASAAFMHRVFEKGARVASPAEFPNLVPSSPVGHVSIYLALRGPAFATADLSTSGESAFAQAVQLVTAGEAPRFVAGAVELQSAIVDRVLAELFDDAPSQAGSRRADLAAAVLVEDAESCRKRGGVVLARVSQVLEWRDDGTRAMAALRPPGVAARAEVVLARATAAVGALLDPTGWARCKRIVCASAFGESDALGAAAIAIAASRVGRDSVGEALVVGLAQTRGFAIVLTAP